MSDVERPGSPRPAQIPERYRKNADGKTQEVGREGRKEEKRCRKTGGALNHQKGEWGKTITRTNVEREERRDTCERSNTWLPGWAR